MLGEVLEGLQDLRNDVFGELTTIKRVLQQAATNLAEVDDDSEPPSPIAAEEYHDSPEAYSSDASSSGSSSSGFSSPETYYSGPMANGAPRFCPDEAYRAVRRMEADLARDDDTPGPLVAPGEPSIPADHTAQAGRVLAWPAIQAGVRHLLVREGVRIPEQYPLRHEELRGLPRLHGRGSGPHRRPADAGPVGGLDLDLHLDLDPRRVWYYVTSYKQNIQNMHPLIVPGDLHAMVQVFLERMPAAYRAWEAGGGLKRKRGPGADGADRGPARLSRGVDTALVLLILALGKISLHKARLPDLVQEGDPRVDRRNANAVPGLDYFAVALDVLGGEAGGAELHHVWAGILAGLYYAQLGWPVPSARHIANASWVIQSLVRP